MIEYIAAPILDELRVAVAAEFMQLFATEVPNAVTFGKAFTVADVVYVSVQAEPVPLFTATVYVPVADAGAEVTLAFAVVAFVMVAGPVQE